MDEDRAWINFLNTGSVTDYLIYSQLRSQDDLNPHKENLDADKYRRSDTNGNEYFG